METIQDIDKKISELKNEIQKLEETKQVLTAAKNHNNWIIFVSAYAHDMWSNWDSWIEFCFKKELLEKVKEAMNLIVQNKVYFYEYELRGKHSEDSFYFTDEEIEYSNISRWFFTEKFNQDLEYELSELWFTLNFWENYNKCSYLESITSTNQPTNEKD